MYQSSSRSWGKKKKPQRPAPAMAEEEELGEPAAARRRDGYVQDELELQTNTLKTAYHSHKRACSLEENLFSLEFEQSSLKGADGTAIKEPLDEKVLQEMESKRSSPSLIARLMGLDTLPSHQVVDKQQKLGVCFKTASSTGVRRNFLPPKEQSFQKSTNENQEFKDVFEVTETSRIRNHKSQSTRKGKLNNEQKETEMDIIRQKFMDAKRLSAEEALQCSKVCNHTSDILDSNKDLLPDFLQDPNSLFAKHLHDLSQPSSSHPCQITVLKSSKDTKRESGEVWSRAEVNPEKHLETKKEVRSSSFQKPASSLTTHYNSSRSKSSSVNHMGKSESRIHPTPIVVLKSSLEKSQKMSDDISFGRENFHFGSRKHKKTVVSGIEELHKEGREKLKLSDDLEYSGHKVKGSREFVRKITRQMRQTKNSRSKRSSSDSFAFIQDESSPILPDDDKLHNYELFSQMPDSTDEWSDSLIASSCSSKSSLSRKARKRPSDSWKVTRRFQEIGLLGRGSNTLGEMLALSNREIPNTMVDSLGNKKLLNEKFFRNEVLGTWDFPSGISSNNSRRDGSSKNLPTSKSLPKSTLADSWESSVKKQASGSSNYYMLKDVLNMGNNNFPDAKFRRRGRLLFDSSLYSTNKYQPSHSVDENRQPERDIHVNSRGLRKSIHVIHLSEEKPLDALPTDESFADNKHIVNSASVPVYEEEPCPLATHVDQVKQFILQVSPEDKELAGHSQNDNVTEEISSHHPRVDLVPCQLEVADCGPPLNFKECEQPSPVSVLEPPSEEETSASGCFERLSADLQELRMQLKLLKLESGHSCADELDMDTSSGEDCVAESRSFASAGEILQKFRSEDDRDFSYLLDILIVSGVHCADLGKFSGLCDSLGYAIGQHVFDKLEKKYSAILAWSRSERKLLFDIVNHILSDLVTPRIDLHLSVKSKWLLRTWDREGLVEGLWQMVVKQRKEMGSNQEEILGPRWLALEDESAYIGREVESMISHDLLDELVAELIIG